MNRIVLAFLACAALVAGSSIMHAETVNFNSLPYNSSVSTFPGLTVSLEGGPDSSGSPIINAFGDQDVSNSNSGNYPTAEDLNFAFTSPVSAVSFTFSNYGDNSAFGPSFYTAFDGATVVDSGNLGSVNGYPVINVTGSGITDLQIDNGSGGSYSWLFGVGEVTFTPSSVTPEPDSFLLMGSGLLGLAGMLRRKFLKN